MTPKGQKCCEKLHGFGRFFSCGATAKVMRDGKPYCLRHDPVKVAERQAARDAKREAEWAESEARHKKIASLRSCERAVLGAAKEVKKHADKGGGFYPLPMQIIDLVVAVRDLMDAEEAIGK